MPRLTPILVRLAEEIATRVPTTDARLTDARTPIAHGHIQDDVLGLIVALAARELVANRNAADGYCGLDATAKIPAARLLFGSGTGAVCEGNDARLADARSPLSHSHAQADVTNLVAALAARILDTDSRLSDARTPLAHGHAQADVTGLVDSLAAKLAGLKRQTTQDYTRSLTALDDIPELGFTGEANVDYAFLLLLFYQSAATTCGISMSMNGPASPSGRSPSWDSGVQITAGPSTSAVQHKAQIAADALHTTASVDAANTTRVGRFFGLWPVGATGGTITPRFASEVAGTVVTIKKGSWLITF